MTGLQKKLFSAAPFLVLLLTLALRFLLAEYLEDFSLKVFDRFQRWQPRVYEDAGVAFVDIDDATLAKLGQWPWPRTLVAQMVERLGNAGAAAITFDIVFAEADRTSPGNILKLWPESAETAELAPKLAALPDHDAALAEIIAKYPVVTGFILINQGGERNPAQKAGFAYSGDNPAHFLPSFKGAVTSLEKLEKNAKGNGSFNFLAETDGVIRRVPVVFRAGETLYPSLFAEALRVAQGAAAYMIKSSGSSSEMNFGERTGMVNIKIGEFVVPTDAYGKIWLYDTGTKKERSLPAWKIFEQDFDEETVRGKILFIGSSASGLKDLRATPLNPVSAGTEIHVQLSEQIITGNFLNRPDWAPGAETIYLVALGFILILLLPRLGALWCAVFASAAIAAACAFSWHAFTKMRLLFDPVVPSLACLLIYLAVSLLNYLRTESDKKQIRGAFSRYLSPELVKQLANHPDQLKLGGEMREMTVLFADIRGFTTLSEKYSAHELTHFMNRFLTPMTDIILKHKGTIDKYIGDCIMAFWNAPLDDPKHAENACAAALEMLEHLEKWNAEMARESGNFSPVKIGIGINTGTCCVGNMGSDQRFDYSVLGDDVNIASRLQSLSPMYGSFLIAGEAAVEKAGADVAAVEVDCLRVKGKTRPVKIYSVLGGGEMKKSQGFKSFENEFAGVLKAYRSRDWGTAASGLVKCGAPGSGLLEWGVLEKLYSERIQAFKINPPPQDWSGVFIASSK